MAFRHARRNYVTCTSARIDSVHNLECVLPLYIYNLLAYMIMYKRRYHFSIYPFVCWHVPLIWSCNLMVPIFQISNFDKSRFFGFISYRSNFTSYHITSSLNVAVQILLLFVTSTWSSLPKHLHLYLISMKQIEPHIRFIRMKQNSIHIMCFSISVLTTR